MLGAPALRAHVSCWQHQKLLGRHVTRLMAAAAAAAAAPPPPQPAQHADGGRVKRRRLDSPWTCPGCSNPFPSSDRLLGHMHKCCDDLLRPAGGGTQPQASDAALQSLLAAAVEQEQALRLRVLRLQYVRDAAPDAVAAAADAAGDADCQHDDSEGDGDDDGAGPQARAQQQQQPAAAAAGAGPAAAATAPQLRGRRRRNPNVAVRTPEQIAQLLKLPIKRVQRLLERAPRSIKLVADPEPLAVVHEDATFLAVSKPPGLRSAPVHRFVGGSAFNRMIGLLGYEPHLLHRLDMNTSGVLVAAKTKAAASAGHAQFRGKTAAKAYLCLALGVPAADTFDVDAPIGDHDAITVARSTRHDGLPALTHMQVLSVNPAARLVPHAGAPRGSDATPAAPGQVMWGAAAPDAARIGQGACLVCCRPVTGRTHQIRLHMAHAGHPLLGDELYGLQGPWIGRQALHALALTLQQPDSGEPVTFVAPPPRDFAAAAAALGLTLPSDDELAVLARQLTRSAEARE